MNKRPWILIALLFPLFRAAAGPPGFSIPGGIYTNEITLQLNANPPGAAIHITLDGSEPTATSTVYTAALAIRKSTVVRARSFEGGAPSGEIVSQTYTLADPDVAEFSSNLPLVIINTFGQRLSHEGRVPVSMRFINRDKGRTRLIGSSGVDSRAMINIRGTSSLQFPKHSFTFRTKDEAGNTLKAPLLGFPSDSEWVLYAPYPDKSLIRDVLAYDLSRQMGHYAPRTRFVEVFVSDSRRRLSRRDYAGVYVFEEKIKQGPARVNIAKLGPEENKEPEISGGYIFKKDHEDMGATGGFNTSQGIHFFYVEPREDQLTPQQKSWLTGYLNEFEGVLAGPDFNDPLHGYAAYIDPASFIDFQWMVEMSKNIDGYRLSNYLHKDRNGKLKTEPIWDWNLSFGNANYMEGWIPEGWYARHVPDKDYPWFRRLFKDPDFRQQWIDRWAELRTKQFALTNILARIDGFASELQESQERNFRRWPILGQWVWPNSFVGKTYPQEIDWMKKWIEQRLAWIDRQVVPTPVLSLKKDAKSSEQMATLTVLKGEIYYTLDGTDPRSPGGEISNQAKRYTAPVQIGDKIFARTHSTNRWSAPMIARLPK
jgi:hypothetical protein